MKSSINRRPTVRKVVTPVILVSLLISNFLEIQHFDSHQLVSGFSLILFLRVLHLVETEAKAKTILISTCAIILSFCIPFCNYQRWIISLILILIFLIRKSKAQSTRKHFEALINPTIMYLIFINIFVMLKHFGNYVLQFSTYGYDNALHFSLYKAYRITNWFPFVHPSKWSSNFELFHNYPSGQSALFSYLSELNIGSSTSPLDNLMSYFLLNSVVLASVGYLSSRLIFSGQKSFRSFTSSVAGSVIAIAFAGIFFTDGFPPYLFGLFLVLLWTRSAILDEKNSNQVWVSGFLGLVMLFISPLILLCIIIPIIVLSILELRNLLLAKSYLAITTRILFFLFCAILALKINAETSSRFGWRQILSGGGIQPPNVLEVIILMACVVLVTILSWRQLTSPLNLVLFSTAISFVALAAITIHFAGTIQYYAIKQFYLLLVISSIVIFKYLSSGQKITLKYGLGTSLIVLLMITSIHYSKVFTSGFMGTLPRALNADLQKGAWDQNVVNSNLQIKVVSLIPSARKNDCVIFRVAKFDSDLNSRWANSLSSSQSTSNSCFNAYWNSNAMSDEKLLARLAKIQSSFILAVSDNMNFTNIPKNVLVIRV